jgi:hypothetical protein
VPPEGLGQLKNPMTSSRIERVHWILLQCCFSVKSKTLYSGVIEMSVEGTVYMVIIKMLPLSELLCEFYFLTCQYVFYLFLSFGNAAKRTRQIKECCLSF